MGNRTPAAAIKSLPAEPPIPYKAGPSNMEYAIMAIRILTRLFDNEVRSRRRRTDVFMALDYPLIIEGLTAMIIKDQTRFMGSAVQQKLHEDQNYGNYCRFTLTSFHKRPGSRSFLQTRDFQHDVPIDAMMDVHDDNGGLCLKTARHFADQIRPLWRRHIARERVAARNPGAERHL